MRIGYFSGDILKILPEDLPVLKPTFFPAVPRLYNRIYGVMQSKIKQVTGCKAWLIERAFAAKIAALNESGTVHHGCYDALVFKKMSAVLGGNVRAMLTGSAPLAKDVMDFFKVVFSSQFVEAYGMTETTGGSVMTRPGDCFTGHVGGPVANVKIRLKDLPEHGYMSTDKPPRGEVCFWGSSIMKGYFRNPEKTTEALTADGWMQSGDVGVINANGTIQIIDRAKNIFKLSQGEYISPEKVENVFIQSDYLAQTFVHGDSTKDYCVMVGVVDPAKITQWAGGKAPTAAMMEDMNLIEVIYNDMLRLKADNKLNSLEMPKQLYLTLEPFSVDNEILTPTAKLKRNVAKVYYKDQIIKMYEAGVLNFSKKN